MLKLITMNKINIKKYNDMIEKAQSELYQILDKTFLPNSTHIKTKV